MAIIMLEISKSGQKSPLSGIQFFEGRMLSKRTALTGAMRRLPRKNTSLNENGCRDFGRLLPICRAEPL
jgi:hypothetical protein